MFAKAFLLSFHNTNVKKKHEERIRIWISLEHFKTNRFQLLPHFLNSTASVLGWKVAFPIFTLQICLKMLLNYYYINFLR